MPRSRMIWPSITAAALVAVSVSLIAAATAPRPAQPEGAVRTTFRRPPQFVADGHEQTDPVWRLGQRLFFDAGASGSAATAKAGG